MKKTRCRSYWENSLVWKDKCKIGPHRAHTDVTLKPSLGSRLGVQSPSLTPKSHVIIQLRMYYEYLNSVFCEPEISYSIHTRLQGQVTADGS
ncbi:hypothetical protein STEG23_027206 [Scotinomys teguina]